MVDIHDPNCDLLKIFEEYWEYIAFSTWFTQTSFENYWVFKYKSHYDDFEELDQDVDNIILVWLKSRILHTFESNIPGFYKVNYDRLKELGVTWPGLNSDTLEQAARVRMTS